MHPSRNNIGAFVIAMLALQATTVTSGTASDINGETIDREGYDSCVFHASVGTATDSSAQSHQLVLQHSDDGSTWTNVPTTLLAALDPITADKGELQVDIDLAGFKRYVRTFYDASASSMTDDGATATNRITANFILGGAQDLPV